MPRLATLLRPLHPFKAGRDDQDSDEQPEALFPCPHCPRLLKSEGDRSRHLTLRASCRREEERLARTEYSFSEELASILEELRLDMGVGGQSEAESEAESKAGADAEAEPGAQPEVEPEARTRPEGCPPVGPPKARPGLFYNEREGVYVEPFPDPRAGAPINDTVASLPDLDAYMAAAGDLGKPLHFDTLELLMTTGLTAGGRDQHLKSHLYIGRTPWPTNKAMMDNLDKLPHGPGWGAYELQSKVNEHSTKRSYLLTRDVVGVVGDIMANPGFNGLMHFAAERHYTTEDCSNRVYGNPWTANWWWRTQYRIPDKSATIIPLIIASDRTRLSSMSGGQEGYPVYVSVANIDKSVRRQTSSGATVLLAYLPVEDFENVTDAQERARLKNELTHRAMEKIMEPLRKASKEGVEMLCADGRFRRGYPIVAGVVGDWPEQCMMGCTAENRCPKCVQPATGRGAYPAQARPRTNHETLEALSRYFKHKNLHELEALGLKPWWPWWANLPYVDFAAALMPDVLHQLHQGMVKTHVVRWVRELVGKRRVDQCYIAMPEAEGMRHFGKGLSKLKGQWTGRESREVAKQLLPVAAGQRATKLDPDLSGLARTILEFSYRAHASRMTDEDINRLEETLAEFHRFKNVLIREKIFKDDSRFDRIAKLHMLSHYAECIREMGTPDNYSTEGPEHLHIECVKRGWRASNKVRPTQQMVKFVQRYEALRIHRAHMDRWLGIVRTGANRRRRKSRVVFGEDVEGPLLKEYETQARGSGIGAGDGDGEDEGEEQERREEQDEAAEGPQVQLEGRRRESDADRHVVYPNPTLSIAVNANGGRLQGHDIIDKHGAVDFIKALHVYLNKHPTRDNIPNFFLPTVHHHFLVWNRLYLHHRPLPFDPEHAKRDVIRARPPTHYLGRAFDVALLLHREKAFGLKRVYIFLITSNIW
ncbi:hypothetical protein FRC10_008451 [Ceratobasidium sp. 414]|nr:hypothetical protein FRC10_008451 [Ceratobasidium sp. 414]